MDHGLGAEGRRAARRRHPPDTFEWWYFDTIMNDGSTCVLNFLNKIPFKHGPLMPVLQFNISPPKGKYLQQVVALPPESYSAASDHCAVTMGPNSVKGDLRTYHLHAEAEGMSAKLVLRDVVPGWREGPFLTPKEAATQWLGEQVVIPAGTAEGTLTYNGATHQVTGTCYHDHQWGGPPSKAASGGKVSSWYWGRFQVGDHAVVWAQILGSLGKGPSVPIGAMWNFARGSRMTFDDTNAALTVTPMTSGGKTAPQNGMEVTWTSPLGKVNFTLSTPREIANFGGYLRYLSPVALTSDYGGEHFSGTANAIWEIMTFS